MNSTSNQSAQLGTQHTVKLSAVGENNLMDYCGATLIPVIEHHIASNPGAQRLYVEVALSHYYALSTIDAIKQFINKHLRHSVGWHIKAIDYREAAFLLSMLIMPVEVKQASKEEANLIKERSQLAEYKKAINLGAQRPKAKCWRWCNKVININGSFATLEHKLLTAVNEADADGFVAINCTCLIDPAIWPTAQEAQPKLERQFRTELNRAVRKTPLKYARLQLIKENHVIKFSLTPRVHWVKCLICGELKPQEEFGPAKTICLNCLEIMEASE